jgi:hypothetical protein
MQSYIGNKTPARFAANALTNLTEATLNGLQGWMRDASSDKKEVAEFAALWLRTGNHTLTASERVLVRDQLSAKVSGTHYDGNDIEATTISHGTQLVYNLEQRQIEMTTKSGEFSTIPILPIMPPTVPENRVGMAHNVNFLVANFDISKGNLVPIRQAPALMAVWGGSQSRFDPSKLPLVQDALQELLKNSTTKFLEEDKTVSGLSCSDMFYRLLGECSMLNYVALSQAIVDCLRHFTVVQGKASVLQIVEKGQIQFPFDLKSIQVLRGPAGDEFRSATGYFPRALVGPIKSVSIWTSEASVTSETICNDYRKLVNLMGGFGRGMGKVASSANFCPRQSQATMELNWIMKVLAGIDAKEQLDIKCSKSIISLVRNFLKERSFTETKIIKQEEDLKGFTDRTMIQYNSRPNAALVMWNTYTDIPDVQQYKKKEGEAKKVIDSAYVGWKNAMAPYTNFITNTPVFSESFFDDFYVIPFDHAHDLRATVTTVKTTFQFTKHTYDATTWEEWKKKVMVSNRFMSNFFLSPSILASEWGTVWKFRGDGLEWSEVTGTWEEVRNDTVSNGITGLGKAIALDDGEDASTRTATTTATAPVANSGKVRSVDTINAQGVKADIVSANSNSSNSSNVVTAPTPQFVGLEDGEEEL